MRQLTLYSTAHCSLCDQALDLLFTLPVVDGMSLNVVDVANDNDLMERYAERIPVLRLDHHELNAPFTAAEILEFLAR